MIAGSEEVTCVEVHDSQVVGEVGADLRMMQVLRDHGVSYIAKMTNANTIGMVIWEKDCTESLTENLEKGFDLVTTRPVAIVCAIGSNIAKPGVLAQAAGALAKSNINILAVTIFFVYLLLYLNPYPAIISKLELLFVLGYFSLD